MQRAATQKWVILYFFQTPRGVEAFLVTCGSVARSRFSFCLCFGAFENDNVACHDCWR